MTQLLSTPLSCSPPHGAAPHPPNPVPRAAACPRAVSTAAFAAPAPACGAPLRRHATPAECFSTLPASAAGVFWTAGGNPRHRGHQGASPAHRALGPTSSAVVMEEALDQEGGEQGREDQLTGRERGEQLEDGTRVHRERPQDGGEQPSAQVAAATTPAPERGTSEEAVDAGESRAAGAAAGPGPSADGVGGVSSSGAGGGSGAVQRLTSSELRAYLEAGGLRAEVVPEVVPEQLPASQGIIKSILLMAVEQPLLAVVRLDDRVDERRVADLLRVARRRVRLARPEEVLAHTGFVVGTVPPFGHRRHIRTLVDTAVMRLSHVYGGGGEPDMELSVAVPDLLSYANASVADVTASSRASAAAAASGDPRVGDADRGAGLPLPWPPGSQSVELVGVVAQRRRIAKLLQFANLVPEQVPSLPADGQAVYLRKLWRNPETGAPTEVQLIMGKTLERNLGRERAQALMDQVKVGAIVAITGRVQPHRSPAAGAAPPLPRPLALTGVAVSGGGNAAESAAQPTDASTPPPLPPALPPQQQQRHDVLDVVCHSVVVLHKNKEQLLRALRAARRSGLLLAGISPATAAELLRLQQLQADGPPGVVSEPDTDSEPEPEAALEPASGHPAAPPGGARGSGPGRRPGLSGGVVSRGPDADWEAREGLLAGEDEDEDGAMEGIDEDKGEGRGSPSVKGPRRGAEGAKGKVAAAGVEMAGGAHAQGVQQELTDVAASLAAAAAAATGWRMPLSPGAVRLVCSAAEMGEVHREVLGPEGDGGGAEPLPPRSSSAAAAYGAPASQAVPAVHAAARVVALDCEWAPFERHQTKTPVSILQVATRERVYILDLLRLMAPEDESVQDERTTTVSSSVSSLAGPGRRLSEGALAVSRFLSHVMSSRDVVKLGFQLASDLDRLCESYPHLPCFVAVEAGNGMTAAGPRAFGRSDTTTVEAAASAAPKRAPSDDRAADGVGVGGGGGSRNSGSCNGGNAAAGAAAMPSYSTCSLCVDVVALARCVLPDLARTPQISLSRLVALVLGEPLDKSQQRSDWACRPLTAEQLLYAATDAYCLVALYDALLGLRVDADDVCTYNNARATPMEQLERAQKILQVVPPAVKRLPLK